MFHIDSNMLTNAAEVINPTLNSSSHEIISSVETLTEALNHSLDQYEHCTHYAAAVSAKCHRLGPIYNAAISQYEERTAHISELYTFAEKQLAHITACETYLVTVMLMGICHPNERRVLFEEFERCKAYWDDLIDRLEDLRQLIGDGEVLLERNRAQLEGWMEQLDEWEDQRRVAVMEGEGYLDEACNLWEERNVWLVLNGLAPIEDGL